MQAILRSLLPAAALLAVAAMPVQAAPIISTFSSDALFNANAGFTKEFGANVRWARGSGSSGDWEYSVVTAADAPVQQRQLTTAQLATHSTVFSWTSAGAASLAVAGQQPSEGTFTDPVNTIALRAFATSDSTMTRTASLSSILVTFTLGGAVSLDPLSGDGDGQYIMLRDDRLAGGFTLTAFGQLVGLAGSGGSDPSYQFKVGNTDTTVVPVPGALPLLLSGLAVFGWLHRRRPRA